MKTLLIFILTSALIVRISFYLFNKYSKAPNELTQYTSQNILKFPDATNWEIKNNRNICIPGSNTCIQPTIITFGSQKDWGEIYSFYKGRMQESRWTTNSSILTSIPTSIVFTNDINCRAELSSYKPIASVIQKPQNNQFKFSVACP